MPYCAPANSAFSTYSTCPWARLVRALTNSTMPSHFTVAPHSSYAGNVSFVWGVWDSPSNCAVATVSPGCSHTNPSDYSWLNSTSTSWNHLLQPPFARIWDYASAHLIASSSSAPLAPFSPPWAFNLTIFASQLAIACSASSIWLGFALDFGKLTISNELCFASFCIRYRSQSCGPDRSCVYQTISSMIAWNSSRDLCSWWQSLNPGLGWKSLGPSFSSFGNWLRMLKADHHFWLFSSTSVDNPSHSDSFYSHKSF